MGYKKVKSGLGEMEMFELNCYNNILKYILRWMCVHFKNQGLSLQLLCFSIYKR